ncbi:hypothetical protein HN011_002701 [Eciton burchellii]|nr:hypothetical protein HN011_002701 [Eciton burchellii]
MCDMKASSNDGATHCDAGGGAAKNRDIDDDVDDDNDEDDVECRTAATEVKRVAVALTVVDGERSQQQKGWLWGNRSIKPSTVAHVARIQIRSI